MVSFKQFITEAEAQPKGVIKHIMHTEEPTVESHEGVSLASAHAHGLATILSGGKAPLTVSTKFDGAPSFVMGVDKDGRHYVATKSIGNKTPKINYTPEDVDLNHGHAPGLAAKLKELLEHTHKIMPTDAKPGEQWQGDMMYGKDDLERKKGKVGFKPNTIKYEAPENSKQGAAMNASKIGVVLHTHIKNGDVKPIDAKTRARFQNHPDVNNIDPTVKVNPDNFTPEEQNEYHQHMENARQSYSKVKPEAYDALEGHNVLLKTHINDMVRKGGEPSAEGYIDFLNKRHAKALEGLKTQAGRDRKTAEHGKLLQHVMQNSKHFQGVLDVHQHMQKAKDVLVKVLAKNSEFSHTINGKKTGPEGTVTVDKQGNTLKQVDRGPSGFAQMNLLGAGNFQKKAATP
jgi:hypothetical protein